MYSVETFNPTATLARSKKGTREFTLHTSFGVSAEIIIMPRERNVRAAVIPLTPCCSSKYIVVHRRQMETLACGKCRALQLNTVPTKNDRYIPHKIQELTPGVLRWMEESITCSDPFLASILTGELADALLTFIFSGDHFYRDDLSFALPLENPAWS